MNQTKVEPYSCHLLLGSGGTAEVYLGAKAEKNGAVTPCAIKRVLDQDSVDPQLLRFLQNEATVLQSLQHPNIVRLYDFCRLEGSLALVMEFVEGDNLRVLLANSVRRNRMMSQAMAVYVAAEIASGLAYAHKRVKSSTGEPLSIVHRDVSPENILISIKGEVKLVDFGIALFSGRHSETRAGCARGKLPYFSPEQVDRRDLDGRSDVFSLCLVLWEMLTAQPFFKLEAPAALVREIRDCKWRTDDLEDCRVDQDLTEILARGLSQDPDQRFQTAGELESALRNYLADNFPAFGKKEVAEFAIAQGAQRGEAVRATLKTMLQRHTFVPSWAKASKAQVRGPVRAPARFIARGKTGRSSMPQQKRRSALTAVLSIASVCVLSLMLAAGAYATVNGTSSSHFAKRRAATSALHTVRTVRKTLATRVRGWRLSHQKPAYNLVIRSDISSMP